MKTIIVLDPGHGGDDSGAVGPTKVKEKDIVLDVAKRIEKKIRDKRRVIMTRTQDEFVSLQKRCDIANMNYATFFLSLHCNAGGGHGFEAFTTPGETKADAWATSLLNNFGARFPSRKLRHDPSDGDPDKEARFYVLKHTNMPSVLFEIGFIDHTEEEAWLAKESVREEIAQVFADTLLGHKAESVVRIDPTSTLNEALELCKLVELKLKEALDFIK